jgi:DNA polymerase phi
LEQRDPGSSDAEDEGDEMSADEEQDEESDSESSSASSSENGESIEVDTQLREDIAKALQVNGVGLEGGNDSESSEELMDDDQMMQLDEHLAQIFRSQSSIKNRKGQPMRRN